ncbi:MAG: hypothetical protein HYY14_04390 [Candidatus Omnitrophica bacterium]|nr:hypothetical protein [Candidatus Omnitrophota bacterium]
MKMDDLVIGTLIGIVLGIHYGAELATYNVLFVVFLVLGGLKLVLKK